MNKCAEDMNVTWPYITEDIREYLSDCGCAVTKNNRRKCASWGKPEALLPDETSYALGLYTYAGKIYLSILHLKSESFWSLEVPKKTAEVITDLLVVWAESLGLDLSELTFLTDRGGEFAELSPFIKDHVKTASYHPEANGKIERRHKEVSMLCRLYDCDPPLLWLRCGTLVPLEVFKSRLCLLLVISS